MKAEAKSPAPSSGSGRETPLDMDRVKPATPVFSEITAAQVMDIFYKGVSVESVNYRQRKN